MCQLRPWLLQGLCDGKGAVHTNAVVPDLQLLQASVSEKGVAELDGAGIFEGVVIYVLPNKEVT